MAIRGRAYWRGRGRIWIVPLAAALAATLPSLLGGRWGVDTGWYAGVAMEALREGHWWTLRTGEDAYFNKPPLAFWILAGFLGALGPHLWAIRLCMIAAVAGCVLVTTAIGRRLAGPRVGMLSGLVLALTPEFFRNADRYRLDYWHLLFMLGAVWCGAVMAAGQRGKGPRAQIRGPGNAALAVLGGACIGLALLTKPFFALGVIPFIGAWFIAAQRGRLVGWLGVSLVAAIAVAAPWHLSMIRLHGDAFVNEYILNQSLARAAGGFENEPWWHYLAYLAKNHWPWLAVLVFAAARPRAGMFRSRAFVILAVLWPLAWLLALSVFGDKRKQYLLPVYPGLAWVCAAWLAAVGPAAKAGAARRIRWLLRRAPIPALLAGAVAAFGVMPWVRRGGTEEWEALYGFMRGEGITEIWRGSLNYDDAGMVYVRTGVWPRRLDAPGGPAEPPPGAWVLYDDAPEIPPQAERVWASGDLVVARWRPGGEGL